jgi:NTE family protein
VITGTSAGAVSAVALASDPAHFRRVSAPSRGLAQFSRAPRHQGRPAVSMLRSGLQWIAGAGHRRLAGASAALAVRQRAAAGICCARLDLERIPRALYKGHLRAIGICATSYSTPFGHVLRRRRRSSPGAGRPARDARAPDARAPDGEPLDTLPVPAGLPGRQYYGDGAMRQTSPLSPAIHLGANRLLVIGVGSAQLPGAAAPLPAREPSFGQMFGFMLDSLFMDGCMRTSSGSVHNRSGVARRIEPLVIRRRGS